eukprot:4323890-Prorocentrum_lima.AAC.1
MTSSLVGSEMCIRDRKKTTVLAPCTLAVPHRMSMATQYQMQILAHAWRCMVLPLSLIHI